MPWKETCAMDERGRFVAEAVRKELSFAALCGATASLTLA